MQKFLDDLNTVNNTVEQILQGKTYPSPKFVKLLADLDAFGEQTLKIGSKILTICKEDELGSDNIVQLTTLAKEMENCIQTRQSGILKNEILQNFRKFLEYGNNILQSFKVVSDVDTSMFGDHVYNVKGFTLWFFNQDYIFQHFYHLNMLIADEDEGEEVDDCWLELTQALALFMRNFYPGMILKNQPTSHIKFLKSLVEMGNTLRFFEALTNGNFLALIKKMITLLDKLYIKEEIVLGKPFKLRGAFGIKSKYRPIEEMVAALSGWIDLD